MSSWRPSNSFPFDLQNPGLEIKKEPFIVNMEKLKNRIELYTYESEKVVRAWMADNGIAHGNFKKSRDDFGRCVHWTNRKILKPMWKINLIQGMA